ncbi:MAG: tyrosine-type recombinase/integrase, partial [Enterobacteriaceae bacterium]
GEYPRISIENAERMAEQCRTWLADGADPRVMFRLESPAAVAGVFTVRSMCELWIARTRRKDKETPLAVLEKHIVPHCGDLPVDSLETRHWIGILDAVAQGTHTGRPAAATARELLSNLKAAQRTARLMQRCTSRALDDIPASFIAAPGDAGTRTLDDNELRDVLRWTTNGKAPDYYRNLVRLLLTFGARTVEIRLSEAREWDLKRRIWVVPPAHSKTGVEIVRPIPDAAMPMITRLVELAHRTKSTLLLRQEKKQNTVSDYCGQLWERLEHAEPWSAHDLRRTMRTRLGDLGVAPWVSELLLGHAVGGIQGIYDRAQQLNEKRKALDAWCAELNKIERTGALQLVAVNQ